MAKVGFACEPPPDFFVSPLCGEGRITASSMQNTFCTAGILQVRRKKNNNIGLAA